MKPRGPTLLQGRPYTPASRTTVSHLEAVFKAEYARLAAEKAKAEEWAAGDRKITQLMSKMGKKV